MTLDEQKSQLFPLLQKAMELELSTIPPYLTALLSIKKQTNRVAANLIRSVMMEEMLHMVLVGNLISSLGGKVSLREENIPTYPLKMEFKGQVFNDRDFDVNLTAFSKDGIETFLKIEMPSHLISHELLLMASSEIIIPDLTIGEFYKRIIGMLEKMCIEFQESVVFCGDPKQQIGEDYYWGSYGKPIIITSMASAREALKVIIKQGEGSDESVFDGDKYSFEPPDEVAHYFRFNEIFFGRRYCSKDRPDKPPSGEAFSVDYSAVFPIKENAKSSDYEPFSRLATLNDAFNRQYSLMLSQLEQAFNGTPSILYNAIINGMHSMAPIAMEMMSLRISDGDETCGAPSFEWISPPI